MSSHPQSVPPGRRTVDTRHLPNPASLPLQLQRAHTVRAGTGHVFSLKLKCHSMFIYTCLFTYMSCITGTLQYLLSIEQKSVQTVDSLLPDELMVY